MQVVSSSQNQTCVFVLCHKDGATQVEEALRSIGFAQPSNPTKHSPAQRKQELDERIAEAQDEIDQAEKKILALADQRADIQFAIDYFTMRSEKYEVISELVQSKRTFVLTGYILAKKADALKAELEKRFDLAVELADCDPAVDPPIMLQNNPFSAPVEGVLESFGLPGPRRGGPLHSHVCFLLCTVWTDVVRCGLWPFDGNRLRICTVQVQKHGKRYA